MESFGEGFFAVDIGSDHLDSSCGKGFGLVAVDIASNGADLILAIL